MSFEFSNKIEELTNKLQHIKQSHTKDDRFQEVKQQLRILQQAITKELAIAEKRVKNVEGRGQKRLQQLKSSKKSNRLLLSTKEQRVSELIGQWVDQYQLKAQQALQDLNKEQRTLLAKKEEEQDFYEREAELLQNKINSQIKMLQKEVGKLGALNAQNEAALLQQLASTKQSLSKNLHEYFETKERQTKIAQRKLAELREKVKQNVGVIKERVEQKSGKTKQILNLLMQI